MPFISVSISHIAGSIDCRKWPKLNFHLLIQALRYSRKTDNMAFYCFIFISMLRWGVGWLCWWYSVL